MAAIGLGGARALLFERLEGCRRGAAAESPPFRVHDRDSLRESVAREVSRLLNTRCSPPAPGPEGSTVLHYGRPDWTHAFALDANSRAELEAQVRRAVNAFEPRLRRVDVRAEIIIGRERALLLHIDAMLRVEGGEEPFSFPVVVGGEE